MRVRIGKTREDNPRNLDSPRGFVRKCFDFGLGSNGNDPAGRHGYRLGLGMLRIQREELPDEDGIRRRRLRLRRCKDHRGRQRKERNKKHAGCAKTAQMFLELTELFHGSHTLWKRPTLYVHSRYKPSAGRSNLWLSVGRQPFLYKIREGLPVTQEKSRNSPELPSQLAWSVWSRSLPQFDRISLRVMHAGKPAGGIGRVNLDLDSCGL